MKHNNYNFIYSMLFNMLFMIIVLSIAGKDLYAKQQESYNYSELFLNSMAMEGVVSSNRGNVVTLEVYDESLSSALQTLAEKARVGLSYNSAIIPNITVDIAMKDALVSDVLYKLLANTMLEPVLPQSGDVIVIREKVDEFEEILQESVSGKVVDAQTGESLPGVNVYIKDSDEVTGSLIGTTTDIHGNFEIQIPENLNTLVFNYVGYQSIEKGVSGENIIDIELYSDIHMLDDVIVVSFGVQERVNMTGSVSAIRGDQLDNIPLTQASQALKGRVPGVTIQQGSGQPGFDHGTIRVRGLGTCSGAGNSPLVLVDGIASSCNDVNPNDIQNISVLKDASAAAIYGARGANGVVLIETKRGLEGSFEVNYNSYVGQQSPVSTPEIMDSWIYAEMENEAAINQGRTPIWSEEEIELFRSGNDPDNYPNINHYDNLIRSGSGLQTSHNISMRGGTSDHTYNVSFGYLNQDGMIDKTGFERYNILVNLNSQMSSKLGLDLNIGGRSSNKSEPATPGGQSQNSAEGLLQYSLKIPTRIAGLKSNGMYGHSSGFTIPGWMDSNSFRSIDDTRFRGSLGLDYKITEKLTFNGVAGYTYNTSDNILYQGTLVVDENTYQGPAELSNTVGQNALLTLQAYGNYVNSIRDHNISMLGGYSLEHNNSKSIQAFRDNFPNDELYVINAGSSENMQSYGSASEWAIQSLFGRINYDYNDRYLIEVNARYDGSSRFPEQNRYALFPSASAGWIISGESFFNIRYIDFLKIHGSWGALGNQNIGNYPYQQTLNLSLSYPLGRTSESLNPAAVAINAPNQNIRWETTYVTNFGLELSGFNGLIDIEAEYFFKETDDILYNISTSYVLGLTPSEVNAGAVENKGWDLSLTHRNRISDFTYSISSSMTIVDNEVTRLADIDQDIGRGLFIGYPLQSIYGYKVDGLFVDQSDIDNYPTQPYSASPGEFRFMDLNGDGKVTAEDDRTIIGNRFPKYTFGGIINAQYKNLDLSLQFTGQAGADSLISNGYMGRALNRSSNVQRWMYENRWSPDNPDPSAEYPRMIVHSDGHYAWPSTYWMRSASFLRLSNLQMGYSFPVNVIDRLGMKNLYLYVSATNLLTLSGYFEGWDPETNWYPPNRLVSMGVNITF